MPETHKPGLTDVSTIQSCDTQTLNGSCHCGAITFEIEAPLELEVVECNCSICQKSGYLHLLLSKENFKLLSGADAITKYSFNSGVAKHTFCKICGIKPFYTPRSNPNGIDINVRCLNTQQQTLKIEKFDGQNWEANIAELNDPSHKP